MVASGCVDVLLCSGDLHVHLGDLRESGVCLGDDLFTRLTAGEFALRLAGEHVAADGQNCRASCPRTDSSSTAPAWDAANAAISSDAPHASVNSSMSDGMDWFK
jgi:hypothetical protein